MALRPVLVVALLGTLVASSPSAQGGTVPLEGQWTGMSAIPVRARHGEVAFLAESRFGVARDVQLGTYVAGLVAPQVTAMGRVLERGGFHVSLRGGLMYPTPFLALVTGSGSGALLPADTTPPQALRIEAGVRATYEWPRRQLLTLAIAGFVAPRFTHTDSPVLDFPFLYPRFAALDCNGTARFTLTGEGVVAGPFRWVASLDTWVLPVVHHGFALEPRAGLAWVAKRRVTLELGYRGTWARYPAGLSYQNAPYADVRVRF